MNSDEVHERGETLEGSPDRLAYDSWSMHYVSKNILSPHRNSGMCPVNSLSFKYIMSVLNNIGVFLCKIAQVKTVV